MKMCCTNFFDDFPALEPDVMAQTAKDAAKRFLGIFGLEGSRSLPEGDKALELDQSFEVLGIMMEMTWCNEKEAVG
eukprot:3447382-Amphidinium_carterae.1